MTTLKDMLSEVSALPDIISMEIDGQPPGHRRRERRSDARGRPTCIKNSALRWSRCTRRTVGQLFRLYVVFSLDKEGLFVTVTSGSIDNRDIYRSLTPADLCRRLVRAGDTGHVRPHPAGPSGPPAAGALRRLAPGHLSAQEGLRPSTSECPAFPRNTTLRRSRARACSRYPWAPCTRASSSPATSGSAWRASP